MASTAATKPKVGVKIRAIWDLLALRNMSQNEFADLCGMSRPYMSRILSGQRRPSGGLRKRMQKVLEVPFSAIFFLERDHE